MTFTGTLTPYSTIKPLFPATKPTWIPDELDQERILSYQLYEQIYWNVPETFKVVARSEDNPIYIPSGRTIVEATNRYTSPKFRVDLFPVPGSTTSGDVIMQAHAYLQAFFTRERFFSKFAGNKRYGLIRGDWLWHVSADPLKPQGSRISIHALDPASYFPIWHPDDLDRILGCHIVEQFIPPGETTAKIKRTTYRKSDADGTSAPGGQISYEVGIFATDDWGGPESRPEQVIVPLQTLPITTLPVYHLKNFDEPQNPFGSSEMRGLERIIAAINQGVSDEELTLAMQGLGMYATDAPPPTDDDDNETDWVLGPRRVVEHPLGTKFIRVNGVGSVMPFQDHLSYLSRSLDEASGTPNMAKGSINVSAAQSGIALFLELAPMIAKTDEKDLGILESHDQMMYDLVNQWFPVYEKVGFEGMFTKCAIGDKMPVDREKRLVELDNMMDRQVISAAYYRSEASRLGYIFPEGIGLDIVEEKAALAEAEDIFAARTAEELGDGGAAGGSGTTDPVSDGSSEA